MLWPEVIWEICQGCNPCLARRVCKTHAVIKMDPDAPALIDLERCYRCGQCVLSCSFGAIIMKNNHSNPAKE